MIAQRMQALGQSTFEVRDGKVTFVKGGAPQYTAELFESDPNYFRRYAPAGLLDGAGYPYANYYTALEWIETFWDEVQVGLVMGFTEQVKAGDRLEKFSYATGWFAEDTKLTEKPDVQIAPPKTSKELGEYLKVLCLKNYSDYKSLFEERLSSHPTESLKKYRSAFEAGKAARAAYGGKYYKDQLKGELEEKRSRKTNP
jgi:hypothetical protein